MKRMLIAALGVFFAFSSSAFAAGDKGSADEAVALVKKVIAAINAEGKDKAFAAINAKDPRFVDRDLYAFVYDLEANCLAHGSNAKMVGRNTIDTQDTDGKFYIKERMELGKKGQPFWQDYKFPNPVTKMIEPKSAYCERAADNLVCVGIYK
ncbi:MAG: cache domain-containing protein [Bacteroidales bacterium]